MGSSELWAEWEKTRDRAARDALILEYKSLVDRVARKIASTMPLTVEELAADGVFGLIDAIDKFDSTRNVRFEAYAALRIRGAIIDGVRNRDWVPRSVRARSNRIAGASELTGSLKRQPTTEEVAAYAGITAAEVSQAWNESRIVAVIDETDPSGRFSPDLIPGVEDPDQFSEMNDLRRLLAARVNGFQSRERLLFALYYHEGLTLAQIGVVLGVTEARVCQIHTRAVRELSERVAAR